MTTTLHELRRPFGRTGLEVSPLGFGGAPIGVLDAEQQQVKDVLHTLLDAGVNVIDTAACYRGSEELIGNAISDRRSEYVLISKCGHQVGDAKDKEWSPKLIAESIDRSLKRLKTDHLDCVLLHSCDLEVLKAGDALGAVVEAREAGKVRFVGYSGDNEAAAYACELEEIAVLQTSVNICDQVNIDIALPKARQDDVGVMAKRPIANAAWKTLDEQYEGYRSYARPYHERFREMELSLEALELSDETTREPASLWPEIALRFTLSVPGVHTAIIGTTNPKHVESNVRAAAKGPLPEDTVTTIRQTFERAAPSGGWEGKM